MELVRVSGGVGGTEGLQAGEAPLGILYPRRAGESGHPGLREEGLEIESCVSEKGLGNLNASIQVLMDLEEE